MTSSSTNNGIILSSSLFILFLIIRKLRIPIFFGIFIMTFYFSSFYNYCYCSILHNNLLKYPKTFINKSLLNVFLESLSNYDSDEDEDYDFSSYSSPCDEQPRYPQHLDEADEEKVQEEVDKLTCMKKRNSKENQQESLNEDVKMESKIKLIKKSVKKSESKKALRIKEEMNQVDKETLKSAEKRKRKLHKIVVNDEEEEEEGRRQEKQIKYIKVKSENDETSHLKFEHESKAMLDDHIVDEINNNSSLESEIELNAFKVEKLRLEMEALKKQHEMNKKELQQLRKRTQLAQQNCLNLKQNTVLTFVNTFIDRNKDIAVHEKCPPNSVFSTTALESSHSSCSIHENDAQGKDKNSNQKGTRRSKRISNSSIGRKKSIAEDKFKEGHSSTNDTHSKSILSSITTEHVLSFLQESNKTLRSEKL